MKAKPPFFSIIIPTYARPVQLTTCLESLCRLDYPRDCCEVIVVDDGSETPVERICDDFRDQIEVILLRQANAGPAAARNTGAEKAKGQFLAFTDDDCLTTPDWLQKLAARFSMTPDHMIGGRTFNALPNNPYSAASQLMTDAVYAYYNYDPDETHFFATNNMALPGERFHAIGGFDTNFSLAASEDREFCARWLRHGFAMSYAPEIVVYHGHALTLRSFWRQHFDYGRGTFHYYQVRARHGWERITVDREFYLHLFRYPLLHVQNRRALFSEALLGLSQVAKTAGFFWEKANRSHFWIIRNGKRA